MTSNLGSKFIEKSGLETLEKETETEAKIFWKREREKDQNAVMQQ